MTEKKQPLPGHETQSDEMNCPSCGRFVGTANKCPYCGSKVEKRMSLLAIRWAAIFLATVGLFLLWMMAVSRDIPVVLLGNIQPTMNFGQIRVIGQIKADARQNRSGGGWRFTVDDGTDSMLVWVSKKQAQELAKNNNMPKEGDGVNFVGSLSISDESSSLRLLSVKEFQLTRAPANEVQLADINQSMVGTSITVAGKVLALTPPPPDSKRPFTLELADDSGKQTLTFWQVEYDQMKDPEAVNGAYVRARVSVADYKGKLQLQLTSGMDIEILEALPLAQQKSVAEKAAESYQKEAPARDFSRGRLVPAPLTPLSEITAAQEGDILTVRASVKSVRAPKEGSKQPFSIILEEGNSTIRVTYWSSVNEVIAVKPVPGAIFEMEGIVSVYKDSPQLKVESGYKVKQIEAAPPATPVKTGKAVSISSLSTTDKGQIRTVRGTLGIRRPLGENGSIYPLTDSSGTLDLVLWESAVAADDKVHDTFTEGTTVDATGEVGEYKGQMQLKIAAGTSIVVNP